MNPLSQPTAAKGLSTPAKPDVEFAARPLYRPERAAIEEISRSDTGRRGCKAMKSVIQ